MLAYLGKRWCLVVEGSRVDHGGHDNDAAASRILTKPLLTKPLLTILTKPLLTNLYQLNLCLYHDNDAAASRTPTYLHVC